MTVLMFQHRFAPAVRAYTKLQTMRPVRKRPIRVGDHLKLRQWAGIAYRSPQLALGFGRCVEVSEAIVHWHGALIGDRGILDGACDAFAQDDGFRSWNELRSWFSDQHGLPTIDAPWRGVLIRWVPAEALP